MPKYLNENYDESNGGNLILDKDVNQILGLKIKIVSKSLNLEM